MHSDRRSPTQGSCLSSPAPTFSAAHTLPSSTHPAVFLHFERDSPAQPTPAASSEAPPVAEAVVMHTRVSLSNLQPVIFRHFLAVVAPAHPPRPRSAESCVSVSAAAPQENVSQSQAHPAVSRQAAPFEPSAMHGSTSAAPAVDTQTLAVQSQSQVGSARQSGPASGRHGSSAPTQTFAFQSQ